MKRFGLVASLATMALLMIMGVLFAQQWPPPGAGENGAPPQGPPGGGAKSLGIKLVENHLPDVVEEACGKASVAVDVE